jgi:hypothetical protein
MGDCKVSYLHGLHIQLIMIMTNIIVFIHRYLTAHHSTKDLTL